MRRTARRNFELRRAVLHEAQSLRALACACVRELQTILGVIVSNDQTHLLISTHAFITPVNTLQSQIQTRLGDDFIIERELGGGGMSRVFLANDQRLDRRVVIKLLRPELSAGVSVERFRREIRLAASLQHALIVPVLDVGDLDGLPYFLMPFIDGESLRTRLTRGAMTVVDTVRILRDVARALAVAHAKGVVHRDIKPDNVLLSGDAAVVADFGVAKAFAVACKDDELPQVPGNAITTVGTSLGTPAYMAPEQVAADPDAGAAMDLYAIGVMAYEMLSGSPPFAGRSPQAIMAAHITESPVPLGQSRPELPAALVTLVMKCLEKDPAKRPASAAALVEALEDPVMLSGSFTPIPDDVAAAISGDRVLMAEQLQKLGTTSTNSHATGAPAGVGAQALVTRRRIGVFVVAAAMVLTVVAYGAMRSRSAAAVASTSDSLSARPQFAAPSVADTSPSVAVLPFVYLGADTAQSFMATAIADAVTNGLSRVNGLRVASRAASLGIQRKLAAGDSAQMPVRAFVEGVIEQERGTVRLTLRLVSAADGFTLWADRIEGERDNLFALEDEVAQAMREALRSHFELRGADDVAPGK